MADQPAKKSRAYVVSAAQIRNMFIANGVIASVLIIGILLLATAGPKGDFVNVDTSQYEQTLTEASDTLSGYKQNTDGTVSIPIEDAMQLIVERGVANPFTVQASTSNDTTTGSDVSAQADASTAEGDGSNGNGGVLTAGESVYNNCLACHQANGQGIPGAFPPLVGHAPELYAADRDYLPQLVLYGLQGEITVNGTSYNSVMTPWAQLSDEDLANVLNYVLTAWGNVDALPEDFTPYTADDIAPHRDQGLTASDIHALHEQLNLE